MGESFRGRMGMLAAAVGLAAGLQALPSGAAAVPASGGDKRAKGRKFSRLSRTYYGGGSRYMPHQGEQEKLRRRQGGNARRIRMERLGLHWDDALGIFAP